MITLARRVHPLVWISSACTCGLLFLLGALSYQAHDREVPPGTAATMQVQQVATSETEAIAALTNAAQTLQLNILQVGANPEGPDAAPWYFMFIGNRTLLDDTIPNGVYPAFSSASIPKLFDGAELASLNQPIRGNYAVQGTAADVSKLRETLGRDGLQVVTQAVEPARSYFAGLLTSVSWPLLVTSIGALALTVVSWVAFSRKATALQEFHGYRRSRVVREQTAGLITVYLVAATVTVVVGSVVLRLTNGWNQYGQFIWWAGIPMLAVGAIAIAVQLLASTFALRLPPHEAVKGARPVRLLGATAVVSHVLMIVLVYAALAQATGAISTIAADSREFDRWAPEQTSVTVQTNAQAFEDPATGTFEADVAAAYRTFGDIVSALDEEGSAILSFHQSDTSTGMSGAPLTSYGPLGGNALVVNNNYLGRQVILAEGGSRIENLPTAERTLHLLIPEHLAGQSGKLAAAWASSTLTASDPIAGTKPGEPFDVITHITASGQAIFNYGDTWRMEQWTQPDPVIAVVSSQTEYFSDYILLGVAANDGNVVFTDAEAFQTRANQAGLTSRLSSISSPASHAAHELRERNTKLLVGLGNALVGSLALTVTVCLLAGMYTRATQRASFVKRTHGWSASRIHRRFVTALTATSAAAVSAAAVLLQPAGYTSDREALALAAAMVGLICVVVVCATAVFDRRARAELITRC